MLSIGQKVFIVAKLYDTLYRNEMALLSGYLKLEGHYGLVTCG